VYQHRQIHVWISESDYLLLREQAVVTRESVSALIRRLIKCERQRLKDEGPMRMTAAQPSPQTTPEILESYASSHTSGPPRRQISAVPAARVGKDRNDANDRASVDLRARASQSGGGLRCGVCGGMAPPRLTYTNDQSECGRLFRTSQP